MTDMVALVSREVLKQLHDECAPAPLPHEHDLHGYVPVASPVTFPAMVHWQVTHWTVQLPMHLTPFSGDTGSGNMTVDIINPAASHTTATNITALAPMMTTLMNVALSCGTKRTYHRAI